MRRGLRPSAAGAVDAILDALGRHSSTRERRALAAIRTLGDDAFPFLAAALRSHPNAFARAVVARSLPRFGLRARPLLLRALRDPAMPVRLHALMGLSGLWGPSVASAVIRLLRGESAGIRHNACRVLARHRSVAAVPTLIRLLHDPVWHVRQQAALALGALGDHRALAALRRGASDGRPAVRSAARAAIGQIER